MLPSANSVAGKWACPATCGMCDALLRDSGDGCLSETCWLERKANHPAVRKLAVRLAVRLSQI